MSPSIKETSTKFNGIYRGLVVDNEDPDMQGRIKIKVLPMFSEITNSEHLPWAVPASPLFAGSGSGFGSIVIPEVDSYVFVFFEAGDVYQPVFFAEAPSANLGVPSSVETSYPYRRVYKTKNGIEIYVDDSTGEVKIHSFGDIIIESDTAVRINPL